MFERFLGTPKTPESGEQIIKSIVERQLSEEVNSPAIYRAFRAAQEKNRKDFLGLTNNHLLNIVKDTAKAMSTMMDDALYGGPQETAKLIDDEINYLRDSLMDEEKRS